MHRDKDATGEDGCIKRRDTAPATYFRSPLPPSKSLNPSQPNAIEFDGDDFSAVWAFDSLSDMTQLPHPGKMSPTRRAFPSGLKLGKSFQKRHLNFLYHTIAIEWLREIT